MEERKIKQLIVDFVTDTETINATEEKPIEEFVKNGEMATVNWYLQGKVEFNGKYVIAITYY